MISPAGILVLVIIAAGFGVWLSIRRSAKAEAGLTDAEKAERWRDEQW